MPPLFDAYMKQESSAACRKETAWCRKCSSQLKFTNIHCKLWKPHFRASNMLAQNTI